jgi:hypothetical protein
MTMTPMTEGAFVFSGGGQFVESLLYIIMNHFLADSLTINEGGVISVIVIGVLGAKKNLVDSE